MSDPAAQENTMASPEPARPAAPRSAASGSRSALRVGVAVVGFALIGASIAVPLLVAPPNVAAIAEGQTIVPVPAASRLVCPGSFIDAGDPETLQAITGTVADVWPADVLTDDGVLEQPDVSGSDPRTRIMTVPADAGDDAATPAGVVTQTVDTETLKGLTASACSEASADSWIVAGSTDVGNTSVLVLANPSAVAATVDLSLFGENGRIDAAGSTGIVVPPSTVRAIPLAGLAPDVQQPVVRVAARGGEITASLQSSTISGLTPIGVESTSAGTTPATEVVIPGFTIASPSEVAAGDDGAGNPGSPSLRILAPGDADATVTVRVANEDPSGSGTSTSIVVPAGRTTEVPLDGLSEGSYTVQLSSDQPVVVAARSTSTGSSGTDYAWFTSTQAETRSFAVANAGDVSSNAHLFNAGQETAIITVSGPSGDTSYEVGPATAITVGLGEDPAEITSDRAVYASVSLAADGRLAAYAVAPPSPLASAVTVYDH